MLSNMDENARETKEMVADLYRERYTETENGTVSNPKPEVPVRWRDLPRHYFYSLSLHRLFQLFHER